MSFGIKEYTYPGLTVYYRTLNGRQYGPPEFVPPVLPDAQYEAAVAAAVEAAYSIEPAYKAQALPVYIRESMFRQGADWATAYWGSGGNVADMGNSA